MAISICSSSSNPLPSLPTKASLKFPLYPPAFLSPSKLGPSSDDAQTVVAAATQAAALASAAAQADALAMAYQLVGREDEHGIESEGRNGWSGARKQRRMRRRKAANCSRIEGNYDEYKRVSFGPAKSSGYYFTPKEEADYCFCLKEEARVEAMRKRIVETREHEPSSGQWAKAMGLKSCGSLDRILMDGRESQERIVKNYRRLVISIASRYQGRGLSLQDMIQEGSIGLLHGAKKFNPERGYKLSTYVYWWIRQAISSAIAKKSRIIRLPGSICELVPRIAETTTILSKRLRRMPTHDEIAQMAELDISLVRLVVERNKAPISMDQAVTKQGCMSLQEIVQGPDEMDLETMVKRKQMKQEVERILDLLCDREALVLRLYYGLDGEVPRSFEEIGRLLKLSRERVRQINRIALSKLRQQTVLLDSLKVYMV